MATLKKVKIRFDQANLVLDETFPPDLEGLIEEPDFEAIIRKVNVELNEEIIEARAEMQKWAKVFACTVVFLVGLVFTPVVAVKARRFREALANFWDDVSQHLSLINRKKRSKATRWLEWRVKPSGAGKRGTDVFDPATVSQIIVFIKQKKTQQKQYQPKQIDHAIEIGEADTSFTGYEDKNTTVPASLLAGTGVDRRVSFVTPFDSTSSTQRTNTSVTTGTTNSVSSAADAAASSGSSVSEKRALHEVNEASALHGVTRTGSPPLGRAVAGAAIAGAAVGAMAVAAIAEENEDDSEAADKFGEASPTPVPVSSATDNRISVAPIVVGSTRPASTSSIQGLDVPADNRMSIVSLAPITEEPNRLSTDSIAPLVLPEAEAAQADRSSVISLAPIQVDQIPTGVVAAAPLAPVVEDKNEPASDATGDSDSTLDELDKRDSLPSVGAAEPEVIEAAPLALVQDDKNEPVVNDSDDSTIGELDKRESVSTVEALEPQAVVLDDDDSFETGPTPRSTTASVITMLDGDKGKPSPDGPLVSSLELSDDSDEPDPVKPALSEQPNKRSSVVSLDQSSSKRSSTGSTTSPFDMVQQLSDGDTTPDEAEDVPEHLKTDRLLDESESGSII